jgi:glycosyltransferase involved in cell wall biosynthesis
VITKPRKLMILLPNLRGGGAERVMLTLARSLDQEEFRTTIVIIDGTGATYLRELASHVALIDLKHRRVRWSLFALAACIRHERPDVVLSAAGHLNVMAALLKPCFPRRTRLIAREAGVVADTIQSQGAAWFWSLAYRTLYGRFDSVVCQSEQMRTELVNDYAVRRERTVVIPNPVDVQAIRALASERVGTSAEMQRWYQPNGVRLVAAGRLAPEKGFDLLIDAIRQLSDQRYRLVILGEGLLREDLQRQILSSGLSEQVQLLGFRDNPFAYFAQAHAFVLSSRSEAFPSVVLEAIACGTAVVAVPARGGLTELLSSMPNHRMAAELTAASLAETLSSFNFSQRAEDSAAALARHEPSAVAAMYAEVLSGTPLRGAHETRK